MGGLASKGGFLTIGRTPAPVNPQPRVDVHQKECDHKWSSYGADDNEQGCQGRRVVTAAMSIRYQELALLKHRHRGEEHGYEDEDE